MSFFKSYKSTLVSSYAGYFVQAIINNFAPLLFLTFQKSFGFSYRQISLLIFLNFIFQLFVDAVSAKILPIFGYRKCIVAAHFLASIGLIGLGNLPFIFGNAYLGVILAILLYAVGSGLIEVIISPLVEACPTKNKAGSMSLLHSFYCWGQMCVILFSTGFFVFVGVENWRLLSCLWAIVPLINAFSLMAVPIPTVLDEQHGDGIKKLSKQNTFRLCALLMFCAGASELAMSQWASAFAESGLKVSKTMGDLLGPCLFAFLMGSARVGYALFSNKLSLKKALTVSGGLCIVCYLVASLSPIPVLSLVCCALCGLSVGIMWPGTFSLAARAVPGGGTVMFAMLALFGDLGCATGPGAVGVLASKFGNSLETGLLFAIIFPALLILSLWKIKE